jgi:hypothetical protein
MSQLVLDEQLNLQTILPSLEDWISLTRLQADRVQKQGTVAYWQAGTRKALNLPA